MRVSLLSVCVGVLAFLSSAAALNDLQCHRGNSNDAGICVSDQKQPDPFNPAYNGANNQISFESYETDAARVFTTITTSNPSNTYDALLDVRRKVWDRSLDPDTQNGVGNSVRQQYSEIGADLPAGFVPFPFQMSYRADGFSLEPHPQDGETVTSMSASFYYHIRSGTINQPAEVSDGNSEIWYLYQPANGLGYTAGKGNLVLMDGTPDAPYVDSAANAFGPVDALPNAGVGTYFQARRVVSGTDPTGDIAVPSGKALQSAGGPNAPANTYRVNAVSNVYDRPVLSNFVTPSYNGAIIRFTLTALGNAAPPAGKVFISQGVLQVQSLTPVERSTTGVPFTGTYSLDTSGTNAATGSFVAGSQKLYVRQTGETDWTPLASSYNSTSNVVTYTLQASDVPALSAAALEMTVQADTPAPSSSTGPDSSSTASPPPAPSSSSTAPAPIVSSSTAPLPPPPPPATPSSSSSTGNGPAPVVPTSSSSTGGGADPVVRSSSSSGVPVVPPQGISSSSSSGAAAVAAGSSSSSTGPADDGGEIPDGAASSVAASGVAVMLTVAAAVAALYA